MEAITSSLKRPMLQIVLGGGGFTHFKHLAVVIRPSNIASMTRMSERGTSGFHRPDPHTTRALRAKGRELFGWPDEGCATRC